MDATKCHAMGDNIPPCIINEDIDIINIYGQLKYNSIINTYKRLFYDRDKYIPVLWKQEWLVYFEQRGYTLTDAFLLGIECADDYVQMFSMEELTNTAWAMTNIPYPVRRMIDLYELLPTKEDIDLFNNTLQKELNITVDRYIDDEWY